MYNGDVETSDVTRALASMHGMAVAISEIDRPIALGAFSSSAKTFVKMGDTYNPRQLHEMIRWGNGGTNIPAGMTASLKELAKAKEKTKINIVITDGQVGDNEADTLARQAKTAPKGTKTYIILIKTGDEQRKMFSDRMGSENVFLIKETSELVPVVARIAKRILMNQA
jgi:uncharacterized protein with von Willebrand factor type A (vWA) domain